MSIFMFISILLGIYGNEDMFDKDEYIRVFIIVLCVSVKKLKIYVFYLELYNIWFIYRVDCCVVIGNIGCWYGIRCIIYFKF